MRIKSTANSANLLESFFESAPQLLLQLTIAIEDDFKNISEYATALHTFLLRLALATSTHFGKLLSTKSL